MILEYFLKKIVYLLYKIRYFGKLNFVNIEYIKKIETPAFLISNHSYAIDLFIPIILNSVLKKKVFVLAAAYPIPSKIKRYIARTLGIIFVTKRLSIDELKVISESLNVNADEKHIYKAFNFYNELANRYNRKAKAKIIEILTKGGLIFSFAQYHQPFFVMEKASEGLGKMIFQNSHIPVFPICIIDISYPPVETRIRNNNYDLTRIDLLTDKKREKFKGEVNIIFNDPIILKSNPINKFSKYHFQEIIDEVMIHIAKKLPEELRGYYANHCRKDAKMKYFKWYEES